MRIQSIAETTRHCRCCAVLLVLVIPLVFGGISAGQGQSKDAERKAREEAARQAEAQKRRQEEVEKAAAARQGGVVNIWRDEQFEQWVFQQVGGVAGARQRFDSYLTVQVDDIDRVCGLSDVQKKKLQLMGYGDVKRFFDAYDKAKRKFKAMNNDVQRLNEIMQDISPLQSAARVSVFQGDSLFAKSLRHILTAEQLAKYDAVTQQRREFHHRAQIELVVGMINDSAPLRDAQRQQLIDLFVKEIKPTRSAGQYDYDVTMYQIGQLPEAKIKSLLTDAQWKYFSRQLAQYKGILPALRQNGMIVDDDAIAPPAAEKP